MAHQLKLYCSGFIEAFGDFIELEPSQSFRHVLLFDDG